MLTYTYDLKQNSTQWSNKQVEDEVPSQPTSVSRRELQVGKVSMSRSAVMIDL